MAKHTGEGELKAGPAKVSGSGFNIPNIEAAKAQAYATVTSIREVAIGFEPTLADDLDHLINQLRDQDNRYLRAIASDPEGVCEGIGLRAGDVRWETVSELAKGELHDRETASDRSHRWFYLLGGTLLGAIATLLGMTVK